MVVDFSGFESTCLQIAHTHVEVALFFSYQSCFFKLHRFSTKVFLEYLHSVVSKIHNNNGSVRRDANSTGSIKFTGIRALQPEFGDKDTGRGEDLDAVIARVSNDDVAFFVH